MLIANHQEQFQSIIIFLRNIFVTLSISTIRTYHKFLQKLEKVLFVLS